MTIDEMISVLQAAKEGKEIEWFYKGSTDYLAKGWNYTGLINNWAFNEFDFRVKPPEPIEQEVWAVVSDGKIKSCHHNGASIERILTHPKERAENVMKDYQATHKDKTYNVVLLYKGVIK